MSQFEDRYWTSQDGLRLHYRDYPGRDDRPPVFCLHGLTRNARDFDGLAPRLSAAGWRVICPDMRGRGDSGYAKESDSYSPVQYVRDVVLLLEELKIDRFVSIGTSMGGLMTLLMGFTMADRVAACVMNDVGPELEMKGIEKIKDYLGQGRTFPTWMHAARALEEVHGASFPDWTIEQWLVMAKRTMTLSSNGRIVFDYDMKIAEPFIGMDFTSQPDLWPGFDALAQRPVLVLRGEISDLFSEATFRKMGERGPDVELVTVPRVGHAPTLDEPEAVAAIERLLAKLA
ncbi:alpha/beta fold hydrolase [Novosphingobium sp. TH158]|uniref:alpha/beta fold hydrolase n=1 Tax=Novosphingobium sp. TH158 TaxID=2067455 RepID=UPI000C7E17A4|nr:alpha/beta hydrolase [Novosphingobium sp. TH158]PLK26560.1 alpha/beta hydrolase [Novosphingobium sp. TH158]